MSVLLYRYNHVSLFCTRFLYRGNRLLLSKQNMYKLHRAEVTYNSDSYEIAIEAHSDSNKSVLSACCFPMDHLHIGLTKYKKSCSKSPLYKTVFLHDNSRDVLHDDMNPIPHHMTFLESRMDLLRVLPPACFSTG